MKDRNETTTTAKAMSSVDDIDKNTLNTCLILKDLGHEFAIIRNKVVCTDIQIQVIFPVIDPTVFIQYENAIAVSLVEISKGNLSGSLVTTEEGGE